MLVWGLSLLLLVSPFAANAKIVRILDFDGSIVNDHGPTATWITPWVLKRVEELHTTLQQAPNESITVDIVDPEQIAYINQKHGKDFELNKPLRWSLQLPETLQISYDEYVRFQNEWAASEASIGGLKPVLLNADPLHPERERLILPGYYREFDSTFTYYRSSSSGENHLLPQFEEAEARAAALGAPATWKGQGFDYLVAGLSQSSTVQDVHVLTKRGQKAKEFYELFDKMKSKGLFRYSVSADGKRPDIIALSLPEARIHGRSTVEQKVNAVRNIFESTVRSAGSKHMELSVDSTGRSTSEKKPGHVLLIVEDEPAIFDGFIEMALKLSGGISGDQVKIVLVNAGSDEDVRRSRFPYRTVVISAGRQVREALPEEIGAWTKQGRISFSCLHMHLGGI